MAYNELAYIWIGLFAVLIVLLLLSVIALLVLWLSIRDDNRRQEKRLKRKEERRKRREAREARIRNQDQSQTDRSDEKDSTPQAVIYRETKITMSPEEWEAYVKAGSPICKSEVISNKSAIDNLSEGSYSSHSAYESVDKKTSLIRKSGESSDSVSDRTDNEPPTVSGTSFMTGSHTDQMQDVGQNRPASASFASVGFSPEPHSDLSPQGSDSSVLTVFNEDSASGTTSTASSFPSMLPSEIDSSETNGKIKKFREDKSV